MTESSGKDGCRPVSEVELLGRSLDEKDAARPGWDDQARRAACRAALEDGISSGTLARIYGADMVAEEAARRQETNSC